MAQTTINNGDSGLTVRNALNTMFSELYAGGGIPTVANFAALPAAASYTDKIYRVLATTGAWYTFDKKSAGVYQSNGSAWVLLPGAMALADLIDISISTEPDTGVCLGYDATNNVWLASRIILGQRDTMPTLTPTNGSTINIDYNAGNAQYIDISALTSGSFTMTASNFPGAGFAAMLSLYIKTGATLPTINLPSGWTLSALPTVSKENRYLVEKVGAGNAYAEWQRAR